MKRSILLLLVLCLGLAFTATTQAASTVTVNTTKTYQTMEGFGAAIAWYDNWLTAHPNKRDIYKLIFGDLNLDILRLRNVYGYSEYSLDDDKEIVQQAGASLGHPIDILLSSWSPPANLKKDNVAHGGTLLKSNGQFVYADFAQWWYDSIKAYTDAGMTPTYISMQNEPDYENSGWETCIFKSAETADYPGYGTALDAVYDKLEGLASRPRIVGAEVAGLGYNDFQNYVGNLDKAHLDAYAYHLYSGGDAGNPDSFSPTLTPIKDSYGDKPNMMTEYSGGSGNWFTMAWLIQNCLTEADASAYLYWNLVWGDSGGMVTLENPWSPSAWTTADGYKINGDYYAIKHFSKYISKGYVRIGASSDNGNLRTSAFLSPDGGKLTIVVLNVATTADTAAFAFTGFSAASVLGWQSVDNNFYQSLSALTLTGSIPLPAKSVTTLQYSKSTGGTPVTGVSVTPAQVALTGLETTHLTATIAPATATNTAVAWTSSDPGIATVSPAGLVSAVADGTATITATTQDGGYTAVCKVTIAATGNQATPCSSPTSAALPLKIDGAGDFCRVTSGDITNINSWNMQVVEINGEDGGWRIHGHQ